MGHLDGRAGRRELVPDIHALPDKDLMLTILARAFVAPAHPAIEVSVEVNGIPWDV